MNDLADAVPCEDTLATMWPSPTPTTPATDLPPPPLPGPVGTDFPVAPSPFPPAPTDSQRTENADLSDDPTPAGTPSIITGPAAVLALDTAIVPVGFSALSLPDVAPKPAAQPTSAAIGAFDFNEFVARPTGRKERKRGRFVRMVFSLAVLGGLGYAGVTYGPGIYDDYLAEGGVDEPAAPMSFPRVRSAIPDVRTATFVLDGLSSGSDAVYTVTVDFETRVSRVVIDRDTAPDLEVLTFSDDALVRRLDSSEWFQLDRGSFPFDEQLQRTDWVRVIDDLVPVDQRAGVVIDESTEAEIGGIPTRHLTITLDPSAIRATQPDMLDPMAEIAAAAGSDETADASAPVTTTAPAVPVTPSPRPAGEPVQVELWIDGQGVVRKSLGAEVLGAQSITILETTPDAWVPDYPSESQVEAITAASLIELGL